MSQKSKVELQKSAEHPDSNRRFRRQPNGSAAGGSSRRSDEFANQPCRRLGQDSWGFVELTGGMWSGSGIMICQCGRDSMVEFQLPKLTTRVRFPSPAPKKLRPIFNLELRPTGGGSFGDRLFLMGASKFCQLAWDIGKNTSSPACISLSQDLSHCPR